MSQDLAIQLIAEKLESLIRERDDYLSKAAVIDAKLAAAALQLGLAPNEMQGITAQAGPLRLPPEDHRSIGTMSAAMLDTLYNAEKGYSRLELREELASKNERFAQQLRNNVNSFYNNVVRYLKAGKIVEVNGLLYHPARAPVEGQTEPLGENVTLFTGKRLGDAD